MSEEHTKRRKKGNAKKAGYIQIKDDLRIKVEEDCLTVEDLVGEKTWRSNGYYTSWNGILKSLIQKFVVGNLSKKETTTFVEARKEILQSIQDVKNVLLGEIDREMNTASEEIKASIKRFAR